MKRPEMTKKEFFTMMNKFAEKNGRKKVVTFHRYLNDCTRVDSTSYSISQAITKRNKLFDALKSVADFDCYEFNVMFTKMV